MVAIMMFFIHIAHHHIYINVADDWILFWKLFYQASLDDI